MKKSSTINAAEQKVRSTDSRNEIFEQASRLTGLHWTVLASALALTFVGAMIARKEAAQAADVRFEQVVERVVEQVDFRMATYETALLAGVAGLHATSERPSRAQWRTFADRLAIDTNYPGIAGIGLIVGVTRDELEGHIAEYRSDRPTYQPYPEHDMDELLPIVYVEPEARNLAAIGLDMAHEARRYSAARRARDTRSTQITAPIQLVQDDVGQQGFLLLAPFYNSDMNASWDAPAGAFLGFVYAPFNFNDLLVSALGRDNREVAIKLTDGESVLFDEFEASNNDERHRGNRILPMFGREWQFEFRSNEFLPDTGVSTAILIAGLSIDFFLLYVFVSMARANRRALSRIDAATAAHRSLNHALSTANSDLTDFAHAASRELRAPLRGIVGLTEWIREDLAAIHDTKIAEQLVPTLGHVKTIAKRAHRMDALIHGVLSYSEVGAQPQVIEILTVSSLISAASEGLGLPNDLPRVDTELGALSIDRGRVIQVLRELFDNSVRHHDNGQAIDIDVQITEDEHHYFFTINDNGPGIEQKFQESAFESFKSLSPAEHTRTSGLGLALARKITESVGGGISIVSVPSSGTRISVRWPKPSLTDPEVVAA
ncbi:MAG: CHASE domain-containing protein [Pseudomonadota bacterium]